MSLTGTEKTIAWAGVWMPAWAMMAFMMFFLSWERVRIKTNSRSEAIETPKTFGQFHTGPLGVDGGPVGRGRGRPP